MKKLSLFGLLALSFSAFAEWTDVSSEVSVNSSAPKFNRVSRQFDVTITVTNQSAEAINGNQRIAISDATLPLKNADGTDEGGTPYLNLSTDTLAVGESVSINAAFQLSRARLSFGTEFWADIETTPVDHPIAELTFVDPELERCVRQTAGYRGHIYASEVEVVHCWGFDIASLADIPQFPNLQYFYTHEGTIDDFLPLLELKKLRRFDVGSKNFDNDDLKVLSAHSSLVSLNLIGTSVDDLNHLTEYKQLQYLTLRDSYVHGNLLLDAEDISVVAGMSQLIRLTIDLDSIEDYQFIAGLTNLETLEIHSKGFDEDDQEIFKSLSSLRLLTLRGISISDLSTLSYTKKLERLVLDNNRKLDLNVLSELPALSHLDVPKSSVEDFAHIGALKQLTSFWSHGVNLSPDDVEQVYQLSELTELFIHRQDPLDNEEFVKMTNALRKLSRVTVNGYQLSSIEGVENLTSLTELTLRGTNVHDLSPLFVGKDPENEVLPSLERVNMNVIPVLPESDIVNQVGVLKEKLIFDDYGEEVTFAYGELFEAFLTDLADRELATCLDMGEFNPLLTGQVEYLNCAYKPMSNLSGVEQLDRLKSVDIRSSDVRDISPLTNLQSLERVYFDYTQVSDLSPLMTLPNLKLVRVTGIPLSDLSQITQLEARGVQVEGIPSTGALISDIEFADAALQECVNNTGSVYLYELTRLVCKYAGIENLSGVEKLRALTHLDVRGNPISDYSILESLPGLWGIAVGGAEFGNEQLKHLYSMESLSTAQFIDSNVTDFSGLANVPSIFWLSIQGQVENENFVDTLKDLPISRFSLVQTGVRDLTPLATKVNLASLTLHESYPLDVSIFKDSLNLNSFDILYDTIADFSQLAKLTRVAELTISGQPLTETEIKQLYPLDSLRRFKFDRLEPLNNEKLAEFTSNFKQLTTIFIDGTDLTHLDALLNLELLGRIEFGDVALEDMSALFIDGDISKGPVYGLNTIRAESFIVFDDSPLREQLTALMSHSNLNFYMNLVTGIKMEDLLLSITDSLLKECVASSYPDAIISGQVKYLFCYDREVTNLEGFSALSGLEYLNISNTAVEDLAPIMELDSLKTLGVDGIRLTDPSQLDVLRDKGVYVFGELAN